MISQTVKEGAFRAGSSAAILQLSVMFVPPGAAGYTEKLSIHIIIKFEQCQRLACLFTVLTPPFLFLPILLFKHAALAQLQ